LACGVLSLASVFTSDRSIRRDPTPPMERSASSGLLRIRGGEDAGSTHPEAKALTREEITAKLNAIPTFCLLNAEGGLIGMRDKEGNEAVRWFLDSGEAKAVLDLTTSNNPGVEGLHLGVHGLGSAFQLCGGWPDTSTEAGLQSGGQFSGSFKLQGSYNIVKETEPRLRELLAESGIDAGNWTLPVFICEQLQSSTILPVFFSPEDLATTWEKAGRDRESIPEAITVMDLRMLVAQMQTDSSPWKIVHFIASPDAIELVKQVQGGQTGEAPARPAVVEDSDDEEDEDDDEPEEAESIF